MQSKTPPTTNQQPPPPNQSTVPKYKTIILIRDAYEDFKIGGHPNTKIQVSPQLAEKMINAGAAKYKE